MTTLFEKAVAKASQLPPSEQDALAHLLLEEIESEQKWNAVLARTPEKLTKLADKASAEHEAGNSRPLDPDQL